MLDKTQNHAMSVLAFADGYWKMSGSDTIHSLSVYLSRILSIISRETVKHLINRVIVLIL